MALDELDGDLGLSRRQLIKRGAIVGGTVLWAAPVVQSVTSPALGQEGIYPGTGCACTATACALRITGVINLTACGNPNCVASVTAPDVNATVLCSSTEANAGGDSACNAQASVSTLDIGPLAVPGLVGGFTLNATVLNQTAAAPCACGPTAFGGSIATLTINGHDALTVTGRAALQLLGITVALNQQTCVNGVPTRRALFVDVLGALQVYVAEVGARASGCPPC